MIRTKNMDRDRPRTHETAVRAIHTYRGVGFRSSGVAGCCGGTIIPGRGTPTGVVAVGF